MFVLLVVFVTFRLLRFARHYNNYLWLQLLDSYSETLKLTIQLTSKQANE